jgi:hypothetical protein
MMLTSTVPAISATATFARRPSVRYFGGAAGGGPPWNWLTFCG